MHSLVLTRAFLFFLVPYLCFRFSYGSCPKSTHLLNVLTQEKIPLFLYSFKQPAIQHSQLQCIMKIGADGLQSIKYVNVGERGFSLCYLFQVTPWVEGILLVRIE